MGLEHINDAYSRIRRSWPAARTAGELKREIAVLDELLIALRGSQAQAPARDLSEQIADLQDTLRLELAERNDHSRRAPSRADA